VQPGALTACWISKEPNLAAPAQLSVAPNDRQRERVLSAGALLGVVAVALVGLVLVFPRGDLLTLLRSDSDRSNQALTVSYLRNLIRTEPRDLNLRFLLIEKLVAAGDLAAARQALQETEPLARADAADRQRWEEWDLSWWQARYREALADNDQDAVRQRAGEIALRLERQVDRLSTPQRALVLLARARELRFVSPKAAGLSRQIWQRLLGMPAATMADLDTAGQQAVAEGMMPLAAQLFFAARAKSVQSDARERLLMKGVKALLASGQPVLAYEAALRESAPLPEGDPFHWNLIDLALGAARPAQAATHLRQVMPPQWDTATLAGKLDAAQLRRAYDVSAAGADLQQALKVAQAALLQTPGDAAWQERHAQVAEWAGKPVEALAAWVAIMKQAASQRALENVFRLAPMLYADDALLLAWEATSRGRALSNGETDKVVQTYERMGDVDGALNFLERLKAAALTRPVSDAQRDYRLSLQAALLERAGRSPQAVAVLEALKQASGNRLGRTDAVRLAQLYLKQGRQGPALAALQAWQGQAQAAFDPVYWELVADLAYEYGQHEAARGALDQLLQSGTLKAYQAERLIRYQLDAGESAQALALADRLYRTLPPDDDFVLAWLDVVRAVPLTAVAGAQGRSAALAQMLAALAPVHRTRLEKRMEFLERRADVQASLGDRASAMRDYQAALVLRPEQSSSRIALWWLLIDGHEPARLRRELGQNQDRVRTDPAYREVLAAAWVALEEPRRALAFLQPMARERKDDFLWLMNYADVLERSGMASPAVRIRRHAWLLASRAAARPKDRAQAEQALMTQVRLADRFASGDQKQAWMARLGQLLDDPQADAATRQQASELVGAWLLSEGRFDAAQRWLWQQQLRRMAIPAYQELALALAQGNNEKLDALLERSTRTSAAGTQGSAALEPADQLAALRELRRTPAAAALGVQLAQRAGESAGDEEQAPLQEDLLKLASRASMHVIDERVGALARRGVKADASLAINPSLRLTMEFTSLNNRVLDATQLDSVPARDRELRLGAILQTAWGELTAQLLARDAFASVRGLYLRLSGQLDARTLLQATLARNERSDDSNALSVAGMRDRLAANLNHKLSNEAELQASLAASHFRTQTGAALGRSADASVGASWYVRRDYPDIRLQGALRRSVIRADGQPDDATAVLFPGNTVPGANFFLGQNSTAFSFTAGIGLGVQPRQDDPSLAHGIYSKAWRPFGEGGFESRRSATGQQLQGLLRLGAKGALAGRDQLSLSLDIRPSPPGQPSGSGARELRIQYEAFFDR
jgi:hypothetical protein